MVVIMQNILEKANLTTEDESKCHKNNKGLCGQNKICTGKRMEAIGPVI